MKYLLLIISLILIILLQIRTSKKENFFNKNLDTKKNLAIHTVFLLKENIAFLEEWIDYHKEIGFNKFYLYDNTGSIGRNGSTKRKNKYNFEFDKIVKLSDNELKNYLKTILDKYPEITYIKWQPKDNNGYIVYGYLESVLNYLQNYKNDNDWTAFIDIDEFIYINKYNNIHNFISNLPKNITQITIKQIKMEDRFCANKNKILEIDNSLEVDTTGWAYKNIIKNNSFDMNKFWEQNKNKDMHSLKNDCGKKKLFTNNEIVFYHFNVNKKQYNWMIKNNKKFKNIKNRNLNKISKKLNKNYNNNFINFDYINKNYNKLCYF